MNSDRDPEVSPAIDFGLSGLLRRLEDRGLVERSTGRGRVVDNHVTDAGHQALAAITPQAEAVIAGALEALGPAVGRFTSESGGSDSAIPFTLRSST